MRKPFAILLYLFFLALPRFHLHSKPTVLAHGQVEWKREKNSSQCLPFPFYWELTGGKVIISRNSWQRTYSWSRRFSGDECRLPSYNRICAHRNVYSFHSFSIPPTTSIYYSGLVNKKTSHTEKKIHRSYIVIPMIKYHFSKDRFYFTVRTICTNDNSCYYYSIPNSICSNGNNTYREM